MSRPRAPTIVRILREDRLLLWCTLALSVLVLLPLTQTDVLPLVDLGTHLGLIAQIARIFAGDPMATEHFMLQPHPSPYLVTYVLLTVLTELFGLYVGAKIVVALAVVLMPLGVMRLAHALGRSPRLGLWAFSLCWDFNQSMGFLAFTVTTGFCFFFLARAVDALDGNVPSRSWWLTTVGLGLLLAMSHAHVAGTASALIGAMALSRLPDRRSFLRGFSISTVPTLSLLPWLLWSAVDGVGRERDPSADEIGIWPNAGARVGQLFESTFGIVDHPVARTIEGLTFLCLLVVPPLYAAARPGLDRSRRYVLAMYGASWLLFLAMPHVLFAPFYQYFINDRHVIYILLLGLLLPRQEFTGRSGLVRLAPGVVLSSLMALSITWQFREFGKNIRPFFAILERIPERSRFTVMLYEHRTPESRLRSITQLTAFIVAEKGGYMPYLFHTPNLPVSYRNDSQLDFPIWYDPLAFDLVEHTRDYDYVVVQGLPTDAQREEARARGLGELPTFDEQTLVREPDFSVEHVLTSGMWQLYQVVERSPWAETLDQGLPISGE